MTFVIQVLRGSPQLRQLYDLVFAFVLYMEMFGLGCRHLSANRQTVKLMIMNYGVLRVIRYICIESVPRRFVEISLCKVICN